MSSRKLLYLVTEDWYFVMHWLPLAVAAKNAGFDVSVATRCGARAQTIRAAGLKLIPFNMDRRGLNPLGLIQEVLALAMIYYRERPVLVHHLALRPVVVGALAARLAGIPRVVSTITGMGFLFTDEERGSWARRGLERAFPWLLRRGLTIVQNQTDFGILVRSGVAAEKLRVIPGSGVDVERFRPIQRAPNALPVVLMPARMLWDKGVREFVETARRLAGRARFVLVGGTDSGNPTSVSEETLRAWQLEGVVEWWGYRENMPEVLNAADIVCLPSYREGLPTVLTEAMACGKPLVTTDAPGCRDCVQDGDNGFLVPVKDVDALVAAIERLVTDPQLRTQMGERGREQACKLFSVEKIIAETLEVYQEACL